MLRQMKRFGKALTLLSLASSLFICSAQYSFAQINDAVTPVVAQSTEDLANSFASKYFKALRISSVESLTNNGTVHFTYDNNGYRESESLNGVEIQFRYDANNRLTSTNINGQNIYFKYDDPISDKVVSINVDAEYRLVYDDLGNVIGLADAGNNLISQYSYHNNGFSVLGKDNNGEWVDMTSNNEFIGNINPIRQGGLYYDSYTGYYMNGGCVYDINNGKYIMDEQYLSTAKIAPYSDGITAYSASPSVIDTMANSYLSGATYAKYGDSIDYTSNWYSAPVFHGSTTSSPALSTVEVLARLMYGEVMRDTDLPGVAWELINRYSANWSGFYGSGKTNTFLNIATKSSAYAAITAGSGETGASRVPTETSQRWISATWYACALFSNPNRADIAILIPKPSGIDKQTYHVGLVLSSSFSGTTASTLKYGSNNVSNVAIIGVNSNITSATTIQAQASTSNTYNVFFNYSAELGVNYTIT